MNAQASFGHCDKVLLVQAEFDGELDAAEAAALADHRMNCAVCQAAAETLTRSRALIENGGLREEMPAALRQQILAQVRGRTPEKSSRVASAVESLSQVWRSIAAGFTVGAVAAAAISFMVLSPAEQQLMPEIVAAHVRALQPGHLEDVVSTDQHTVKPWFAGKLDFSPPVRDLAAQGFPLKGGRLDYVGDRTAAVLVYQGGKHVIDVFVWPGSDTTSAETMTRHGYNLVHWTQGGMVFWAVSDMETAGLHRFAALLEASP